MGRFDIIASSLRRNALDYAVLLILLAIMIIGALLGQYIAIPAGLLLYFVYEVARHNKPEAVRLPTPKKIWWAALALVLIAIGLLLAELSYNGAVNSLSQTTLTTLKTTVASITVSTGTTSINPYNQSTVTSTTIAGSTSTIMYKTQSATAATSSYGSGSIFLNGLYALRICGGASTSTTGASWVPNVSVANYSSIGINYNSTCTLDNGGIYHQFNSQYAAIVGIAMNASGYTVTDAANVTQMFFNVKKQGSFVVAIVAGNVHTPGPYFIPSLSIAYPPGAAFNCNASEQQVTPGVRENSTSFVKSTAVVAVCPNVTAGTYLLSEKNLTDGVFGVYIFQPQ